MIVLESGKLKSIFCVANFQCKEERIMSEKETNQNTINQQSNNEPDLDINAPCSKFAVYN